MTGSEYARLIGEYLLLRFGDRGIQVYREVSVGKSIIGKNRRVDLLVLEGRGPKALAIECKFQESQGTVDEKIPYALDDMRALPMPGLIVYAGDGFSPGVRHLLAASEIGARCLPEPGQAHASDQTRELDHQVAMVFGWWDVLVADRRPMEVAP